MILESKVRDMLLRYSEHYEDYFNIVTASEKGHYLSNDPIAFRKLLLPEKTGIRKR